MARALAEDLGAGDLTVAAVLEPGQRCRARVVGREAGVLCGLGPAREVFRQLDPGVDCREVLADGAELEAGRVVLELAGPAAPILSGERTALNFLQHLSGIATLTRRFVEVASAFEVQILDTRKTAPGLRALEKHATHVGGATNHRMGLYDAVLIKDNHAQAAGGLEVALRRALRSQPPAGVEVEVRDLEELRLALELGAGRVLLDNFSPRQVAEAMPLARGRARVELSGGVTLENLPEYAALRPDFISVGRLTHSAPALDLALEVLPPQG